VNTNVFDDLVGRVRERAGSGEGPPGARAGIMLVDRENGRSLGVTLFDSEEAIREAEPAFERMGDEIPEEVRGRRTSLETYEVTIVDVDEGAKAARVSSLDGDPSRFDDDLRYIRENVVPRLRELEGSRGIIALADRSSGRTKTITLWESDAALRESEESANRLREQAAEGTHARIAGVERYEVPWSIRLEEARV
jgi:heme-degrading monooxygenase HmoA